MENKPHIRRTVILLFVLLVVSVLIYFYARVIGKALDTGLPLTMAAAKKIAGRSAVSVLGMAISATLIATISFSFQTLTENRILTPSMIGFDSIYLAVQAVLVFVTGRWAVSKTLFTNPYWNFLISTAVMLAVSMLMYRMILRKNRNNIVFLLLFGLIVSSVVKSLTNYIEVLLKPSEFQQYKAASAVTINNMNTKIIFLVMPIMIYLVFRIIRQHREFDVMVLGENNARSLGVPYTESLNRNLVYIALAMAITTALVGPLTFLGLLAVNIARELLQTWRHKPLFIGSILVAMIFLILGQGIVELLRYATPVTVLIDLVGGVYMIYLILKENHL